MNRKQFTICGMVIMACMLALYAWSIASENMVIPIVATIVGMTVLYLCKRRMEVIIADERDYQIAEKASRSALQVFIVIHAVIGILLTVLSRSGYPELSQVGQTLTYAASSLLVLYSGFYGYYKRKYGG